MLRRLRIENLVLIREADLELAPGLNAITGETGAGKTILAQAVGLLLGTKGDGSFVGQAGPEAYVEAELDIPDELDELTDLRPEDEDALLVARRVFGDGRTRAYAWGRSAAREDVAAASGRSRRSSDSHPSSSGPATTSATSSCVCAKQRRSCTRFSRRSKPSRAAWRSSKPRSTGLPRRSGASGARPTRSCSAGPSRL